MQVCMSCELETLLHLQLKQRTLPFRALFNQYCGCESVAPPFVSRPGLFVVACQYKATFLFFVASSGSRSSKTFKPKKNIPEGTHQYDLMKHAAATLGSGNLRNAVALPDGEDLNEWVAVNSE